MHFLKTLAAAVIVTLPLSSTLHADGHAEAALKERQAHMKGLGKNLGVLGDMAKGAKPYDAAAATAAAAELSRLANVDQSGFWVEGTDTSMKDSRALPALFTNLDDVEKINADLIKAAAAMEEAAGTDLAAVQAAIGPVGATCGACHKAYRQPK